MLGFEHPAVRHVPEGSCHASCSWLDCAAPLKSWTMTCPWLAALSLLMVYREFTCFLRKHNCIAGPTLVHCSPARFLHFLMPCPGPPLAPQSHAESAQLHVVWATSQPYWRTGTDILCIAAMFGFFFHPGPVTNFEEAAMNDKAKFGRWHRGMLERGQYVSLISRPSHVSSSFWSVLSFAVCMRFTAAFETAVPSVRVHLFVSQRGTMFAWQFLFTS